MAKPSKPPAGRPADEDGDWVVRQFVPADALRRPPEEYVARHAHALGSFAFHAYRYRDPELGEWVRRVGELLATNGAVERCREQYLTPAEAAAARRGEAGGL